MNSHSKSSRNTIDFAVGGQALIEGVMMRSPHHYVMAVRRADGNIVVDVQKYVSLTKRSRVLGLPLIRGVIVLFESLVLGMKALFFSNQIAMEGLDDSDSKKSKDSRQEKTDDSGYFESQESWFKRLAKNMFLVAYFIFVFAVVVFLFKFLPLSLAQWVSSHSEVVANHYALFNLIDGLTKITIFVAYIGLISLLPDIKRVFAYHGAEHQAIWAYEKGKSLTIRNAQAEHPEHPRCGTSFIILVLLLSVLVYTVLPETSSFQFKFLQRVAVIPLLAGLSYEVLKISAKYEHQWWMHWVTLPGLWLQKITTRKPTDDMEEVAIAALKGALEAEKKLD